MAGNRPYRAEQARGFECSDGQETPMPRIRTADLDKKNDRDTLIVAITPAAPGWRAVVRKADDVDGSRYLVYPLLCWALVRRPYDEDGETGVDTEVVPIIADIAINSPGGTCIASHFKLFAGVAGPEDEPAEIARSNRQIELEDRADGVPSAADA
jgi:hypothetical protein